MTPVSMLTHVLMLSWRLASRTKCHSYVLLNLVGLVCFYFCLVNNTCCQAFTIQTAFTRDFAITVIFLGQCCIPKDAFVVIGNDRFVVIHTAVANFDSNPIEDFVEYVSLWKVLVC